MFATLLQDIRYAARTLAARPGFAAAALVTLALAIGANTLVFSLVDGVYLSPLPYRDDARLVDVGNSYPKMGLSFVGSSIPDYLDRSTEVPALAASALYTGENFNLADSGAPERVHGLRATPSLFATLGVAPALGRGFTADEAQQGRDKVVVLGHALWQNRFGADPAVVGRSLRMNGESYRVVGVMPKTFLFPDRETVLYVPFAFTDAQKSDQQRGFEFSSMVARLAPGATPAQVEAQCAVVRGRVLDRVGAAGAEGAQFANFMRNAGFKASVRPLRTQLAGDHAGTLLLLQWAVGLLLLIACANIANLLLARLSSREKELSVRVALGAGRARILRQLLIEALLLSVAGSALGVAVAVLGMRAVGASGLLPDWIPLGLDLRVLAFTAAVATAAGLLFGLAPALAAARAQPQQALREAGRLGGGSRAARGLRNALVTLQFALAVALLASAGLLVRSFTNLLAQSPGFDSEGVLSAAISLPQAKYPDAPARAAALKRLLDAARALPGVESAGLVDAPPMANAMSGSSYHIVGQNSEGAAPHGYIRRADEDYFRTMRIPLLAGRTFEASDWNASQKVAVVDALFAKKRFADGDALGHVIDLGRPGEANQRYTIVGVVGTVKNADLGEETPEETYYLNAGQEAVDVGVLVLRSHGDPAALAAPLRAAVRAVDPDQPLFDVTTFNQRVHRSLASHRVPAQLIGLFAALALLLAAIGIYGVLAFTVAQRSSEFGVRMAIGADGARIRRQVLGDGARLVAPGLALGVLAALALGLVLKSQLFGVGSVDPVSLGAVLGVLVLTAFAACWLPARRAARIAPMEALRNE